MNEFKIGSSIVINNGIYSGNVGKIIESFGKSNSNSDMLKIELVTENVAVNSNDIIPIDDFITMENNIREPMVEMATIISDDEYGLNISVNSDPNRKGVPYFKVYDSAIKKQGVTRVCRLHFKDEGMEHHKNRGFKDWKINVDDIKKIKSLLNSVVKKTKPYTVWQMACYQWNEEYFQGAINDIEKYFDGGYSDEFIKHPSYVPHDQDIPEKWKYKIGR